MPNKRVLHPYIPFDEQSQKNASDDIQKKKKQFGKCVDPMGLGDRQT